MLNSTPQREPLSEGNWKRSVRWSAATKAIGVPTLRVHDLRHTAASVSLGSGADPNPGRGKPASDLGVLVEPPVGIEPTTFSLRGGMTASHPLSTSAFVHPDAAPHSNFTMSLQGLAPRAPTSGNGRRGTTREWPWLPAGFRDLWRLNAPTSNLASSRSGPSGKRDPHAPDRSGGESPAGGGDALVEAGDRGEHDRA